MGKANEPVEVDPRELENAKELWLGFTKLMTVSCIATALILILMAIFLI